MTKLSDTLYWQMDGEALFDTISVESLLPDTNRPIGLMHALNLYCPKVDNQIGDVQLATLESMKATRSYATGSDKNLKIDFTSVNTAEDISIVPNNFLDSILLKRNVSSVGDFSENRNLPLIFDILSLANRSSSTASNIVFTNSDICLTPSFYSVVASILRLGFDSIIINRRTVHGFQPKQFDPIALADYGEIHPGLDCFIFPRSWIDEFVSNTACVGAQQVMRGLLLNLVAKAKSLLVLTDVHLTYHYGDDRPWTADSMKEYEAHNIEQTEKLYKQISKDPVNAKKLHALFEGLPKYRPN